MVEAGSLWLPKSAIKTRLHFKAVGSVIFRSIIASALPYITISRKCMGKFYFSNLISHNLLFYANH